MDIVRAFRVVSIAEATSFLVLLLIAMPLKYGADLPVAVQVMGPIHGILFLGYARVLTGPAAAAVCAAAGVSVSGPVSVAVRRSALVLAEDGPLSGVVVSARATPDQLRLVVAVDGVGEVDAVAGTAVHPGPGERVWLRAEQARLSILS